MVQNKIFKAILFRYPRKLSFLTQWIHWLFKAESGWWSDKIIFILIFRVTILSRMNIREVNGRCTSRGRGYFCNRGKRKSCNSYSNKL